MFVTNDAVLSVRSSDERHAQLSTLLAHVFRPDARLNLTDVCLVEHDHAQPALTDTATDAERQLIT